MKAWSHRNGRWTALAALVLTIAAVAVPGAGAQPMGWSGAHFEPEPYQTLGGATPQLPSLATLEGFSFEGPTGVTGGQVVRPDDRPGLRGPGTVDPVVQPLYPIAAPLSGPASIPTDATPVTTDAPSGGTDWPAIGIAAGLGMLLLVAAALILGTSRRRHTPAHA